MADFDTIKFTPMREVIEDGRVRWVLDKLGRHFEKLPQIFWSNGEPWHEANHWALTKVTNTVGGHIKTATRLMEHLVAYGAWLESKEMDWRHFPVRKDHRAVVLFRGELVAQRDRGSLKPSTASARMRAVIQFYRHCYVYGLVDRKSAMETDRQVTVRYFDATGFQRTIMRMSSDLAIPNKTRSGLRLEDGLTPLRTADATRLLDFVKEEGLTELHLMLSLGVLTGARLETITTLRVKDIESAFPDPQVPDTYHLRVGPGTAVKTKFGVSGELLVPKFLIDELLQYCYGRSRLGRQHLAVEANRNRLFLSMRGNPYGPNSINPLMSDLRKRGVAAGLRFMQSFKFHQTRATFGTWLMGVALSATNAKSAVAFVRDAMLHRDERTTFLYVRFLEEQPAKIQVAKEYSAVFSGVISRDWSPHRA